MKYDHNESIGESNMRTKDITLNLTQFDEQQMKREDQCFMVYAACGGDVEEGASRAYKKKLEGVRAYTKEILEEVRAYTEKGDALHVLHLLDQNFRLPFVFDNVEWLRSVGQYEKALLSAYVAVSVNHSDWPESYLKCFFCGANRDALRAVGDPLPGDGPFVVYRGVGGHGAKRRIRGLSWSIDRKVANWYANRAKLFGLSNPAVLSATVNADQIFAYTNERKEQEFICDIGPEVKLGRERIDAE